MSHMNAARMILTDIGIVGACCVNGGLRYGSMIYICFGRIIKGHRYDRYQAELELGANDWRILRDGQYVIDSVQISEGNGRQSFIDNVVGANLINLVSERGQSTITLSNGVQIMSLVEPSYASGFLYIYDSVGSLALRTLDGVEVQQDT